MPLAEYIARVAWFLAPLIIIVVAVVRRGRNDPRCMYCNYSFAEHIPSLCPECGNEIDGVRVRRGPSFPYHARMGMIAVSSLVLALMPAMVVYELAKPLFPTETSELVIVSPFSYTESIGGPRGVQFSISTDGERSSPVCIEVTAVHGDSWSRINAEFVLDLHEPLEIDSWIEANAVDAWLDRRSEEWEEPDLAWSAVKTRLAANVEVARAGQLQEQPAVVLPDASAAHVVTRWTHSRSAQYVAQFNWMALIPLASFCLVIVVVVGFVIIRGGQYIRAKVPEAFRIESVPVPPRGGVE